MEINAILCITLAIAILVIFKFMVPMKSYAQVHQVRGTPCLGTREAVPLGATCGCDADCTGHVSSGVYCSHNAKICRPAKSNSSRGTPCLGTREAVPLGATCGCDADCTGHVSSGVYCSHKTKICKPAPPG